MFYNTSIPTCIVVLKKHREGRDVLFVDASKQFVKEKKQNVLTQEHISHVRELYTKRENVAKEAFVASYADIEKNDFNLNIPRYVDSSEEEEEIKLDDLIAEMQETDAEIKKVKGDFLGLLGELRVENEDVKKSLTDFIKMVEAM